MPDSSLHGSDVRRLLEIIEDAHVWQPEDFFYASVLYGLALLVPADEVGFQVNAWQRMWLSLHEVAGGRQVPVVSPEVDPGDPFFGRELSGADSRTGISARLGHTGVTSSSEVHRGRRASELIGFLAPIGDLDSRVLLHRHGGPAFSHREVELLRLARPHLAELHLRRRAELNGQRSLTQRQWEILRLVALGATNLQIAHRLGISEGTVRKHLENAFVRLGAASRNEAVSRLRGFL